ncbi:S41 family peptidase [Picrophilus oshimae]|uniref:Peptidase family S41 n=1 Tax=Picrophilus torridus (strain ATCC 700027 / DSM 9790 / JCM 10055 / NBRC 100828 / KAW 2/3) TaxID=1122961 RepID=A0A8G2FVP2_PICTO|nr:S41 family peptidase [Picrophilus oshimae]SMD30337.1 Peptidase family S41 [Picrophilus oshimae DSM 9789]
MQEELKRFTKEEALSDLYKLVKIITETHPDPFMNLGSQIKFYMMIDEIIGKINENIDIIELYNITRKITALIGDSHTFMQNPGFDNSRIWIEFEIIDEKIIVLGVYEKNLNDIIGHELIAVNGINVKELLSKMHEIRASNSIYDALAHLINAFYDKYTMSYITGQDGINYVNLTLMSIEDNSLKDVKLSFSIDPPGALIENNTVFNVKSKLDISYGIINNTGYLRIDSMTRYREAYESILNFGADESFIREMLAANGFESSGDIDKIISKIPSASESIIELLSTMNKNNINDIIIDLRNNRGGNSYLAYILTYFLYGNKIYEMESGYDIERYSSWYKNQYSKVNDIWFLGGYNFQEMHEWLSGNRKIDHDDWVETVNISKTFSAYYKKYHVQDNINVYALCSARTFSAGFDLLDMLKRCGAIVIGIEPSQAANAFINTIAFSLDNSGLKGNVSSKLMLKYPDKPMFYTIRPDIPINIKDFINHNWDANTILIESINIIKQNKNI